MNYRNIACVAVLASLSFVASQAQVIQFQISAQYRGVVKKAFDSIGSAGIQIAQNTDGSFNVKGAGKVNHPKEKAKVYQFALDMKFRMNGDRVEYMASKNTCNAGSEGLRDRVARLLPFLYLVSALPANMGPRSVRTPHGSYQLTYAEAAGKVEVTVEEGTDMLGKFFLNRAGNALTIDKFRIPTKDNVVLNFTTAAD